MIKDGEVDYLMEHLNQVDQTGNIKFTHEQDGQIPFLDTLIVRKEDGTVKLLVCREKNPHRSVLKLPIPSSLTSQTWCSENTY